jgi:hypothetical protein
VLNIKEQMRMRVLGEREEGKRVKVVMVGASQVGRIGEELKRRFGAKVDVKSVLRMEGENTERKNMELISELGKLSETVDVVVIGGPTNSLVRHGKEGERGFGGERVVRIVKKGGGREEWQVRYHLTDPVKISMTEKTELIDRVTGLMSDVRKMMGSKVSVIYMSMMPRFVNECCKGHMTDEEVWLLNGLRRDVDKEIVDRMTEIGVQVLNWWTLLGMRQEMTLTDVRRQGVLDADNVHLSRKMNKIAAESLCNRLLEKKKRENKRPGVDETR